MDLAKRALLRNPETSSRRGVKRGFGDDRDRPKVTATTGVFETCFLWVVRTWDLDIRTREKWIVPAVCHSMSVAGHTVAQ